MIDRKFELQLDFKSYIDTLIHLPRVDGYWMHIQIVIHIPWVRSDYVPTHVLFLRIFYLLSTKVYINVIFKSFQNFQIGK